MHEGRMGDASEGATLPMNKRKPESLPDAYPLQWPDGVERTPRHRIRRSKFRNRSFHAACQMLLREIDLLGAEYPVVSSDLRLRLDGLPYSSQRQPEDKGVAVYFLLAGEAHCLPCDQWDRLDHNIVAVAKHVEALRGIGRWGVGSVKQAFAGYRAALPAPGIDWRSVLGRDIDTLEAAKARHRELAANHHPDRGGDPLKAARINEAWLAAREELDQNGE